MTHQEAFNFIKDIFSTPGETWADLGAGGGTFTLPISQLLGKSGKVFAIDINPNVLNINNANLQLNRAEIVSIQADFTNDLELPLLDGIFMANALHFIKDQPDFLKQYIYKLKPQGKFVFVEYDHNQSSPWVPFPVPFQKLKEMVSGVSLTEAIEINRRPSLYGNGDLYLAIAKKIEKDLM